MVRAQACKVALQLLLLPALLLTLAALMALNVRGAKWAVPGSPDARPSELYALLGGFLAWSIALWWNLYVAVSLMLARVGGAAGILVRTAKR